MPRVPQTPRLRVRARVCGQERACATIITGACQTPPRGVLLEPRWNGCTVLQQRYAVADEGMLTQCVSWCQTPQGGQSCCPRQRDQQARRACIAAPTPELAPSTHGLPHPPTPPHHSPRASPLAACVRACALRPASARATGCPWRPSCCRTGAARWPCSPLGRPSAQSTGWSARSSSCLPRWRSSRYICLGMPRLRLPSGSRRLTQPPCHPTTHMHAGPPARPADGAADAAYTPTQQPTRLHASPHVQPPRPLVGGCPEGTYVQPPRCSMPPGGGLMQGGVTI